MVLDTHVIVWRALQPEKVPAKVLQAIEKEEKHRPLRVCEISLFEIAMLMRRGRLDARLPFREFIDLILTASAYDLTGINPEIAGLAVEFPENVTKDPADRLIAATALFYKAQLVTADTNLRKSEIVTTLW